MGKSLNDGLGICTLTGLHFNESGPLILVSLWVYGWAWYMTCSVIYLSHITDTKTAPPSCLFCFTLYFHLVLYMYLVLSVGEQRTFPAPCLTTAQPHSKSATALVAWNLQDFVVWEESAVRNTNVPLAALCASTRRRSDSAPC